jgi:hypothetical protein
MSRASASTPPPVQPELYEMDLEQLKSKLIELLPEQQTEKRPWKDLLKGSICMGEIHWDVAPKKILIKNMPLFARSGFTVLFMEHLSVEEHSKLLDQYFDTGEMPEVLKTKLSALDEGHKEPSGDVEKGQEWDKYNFTEIVKAAQRNGIRVIPLEESEESWGRLDKGGAIRSAVFSLNAKKVIDQHAGSKWLALVGSSHLNTYYDIPGICDIVQGAQDLLITDANESLHQSLEVHPFLTDIKWATEDSSEGCIKASISLIIDYRSEMSFMDIPTNILASKSSSGSAAAAAAPASSSSSGSTAAAEYQKGKRGQEESTVTEGSSLLRKKPSSKMAMPQKSENESKICKLSEKEIDENKGRK